MTDNDEWLNDARSRLAKAEPRRSRTGSTAAKVAALLPELQAARAAGKTWAQIAAAISDGGQLRADTVRITFARVKVTAAPSQPMPRATAAMPPKLKPNRNRSTPVKDEDGFSDMFGPMFDARDTLGRQRQGDTGWEAES